MGNEATSTLQKGKLKQEHTFISAYRLEPHIINKKLHTNQQALHTDSELISK
jgi:hypothetical protein